MQTYPVCPRCQSSWQTPLEGIRASYQCHQCGMRRYDRYDTHEIYAVSIKGLLAPDHVLGWMLDERTCHYATIQEMMDDKGIQLPFLPFDVLAENLKNLILSSSSCLKGSS